MDSLVMQNAGTSQRCFERVLMKLVDKFTRRLENLLTDDLLIATKTLHQSRNLGLFMPHSCLNSALVQLTQFGVRHRLLQTSDDIVEFFPGKSWGTCSHRAGRFTERMRRYRIFRK
mmetsp:Transcript_13172/g.37935  ORF Transcript_13172/g.37935 Transcript_13172/m.37935 type:complete len:116 (+) Transcript_13172:1500-1847(+)